MSSQTSDNTKHTKGGMAPLSWEGKTTEIEDRINECVIKIEQKRENQTSSRTGFSLSDDSHPISTMLSQNQPEQGNSMMDAIMKVDERTREMHLQSQEQFGELRSWLHQFSLELKELHALSSVHCQHCGPLGDGPNLSHDFETMQQQSALQHNDEKKDSNEVSLSAHGAS